MKNLLIKQDLILESEGYIGGHYAFPGSKKAKIFKRMQEVKKLMTTIKERDEQYIDYSSKEKYLGSKIYADGSKIYADDSKERHLKSSGPHFYMQQ